MATQGHTVDTRGGTPATAAWSVFAISGVVSLVVGILVLAYPGPSVKLLGVFLGIDLVIVATLLIVRGVAGLSPEGSGQGSLLLGILGLIAGVVVIRNPGETVTLLALALAIYLIVAGALALAQGLISSDRRAVSLLKGVVLVAAGTVIVAWPDISLNALVVLAGIALILQGIFELVEALLLRSLRRAEP